METLTALPPVLAAVIGLLLLAWLVLLFLVPFMIEGIRSWTRRNHEELRALNQKIDRLAAALESRRVPDIESTARATMERAPDPAARAGRTAATSTPPHPPAGRREPTLSELPTEASPERKPARKP